MQAWQGAVSAAIPKIEPILLLFSTPRRTCQQILRGGQYATRKSQTLANESNMQELQESHFTRCRNSGIVLHRTRQFVCQGDQGMNSYVIIAQ